MATLTCQAIGWSSYLTMVSFLIKSAQRKRCGPAKTSLFGKISQNFLGKMTTIIHSLWKMYAPSCKAVDYLPRYLTMLSVCLKSVCGESYGSTKTGVQAIFFTKMHSIPFHSLLPNGLLLAMGFTYPPLNWLSLHSYFLHIHTLFFFKFAALSFALVNTRIKMWDHGWIARSPKNIPMPLD